MLRALYSGISGMKVNQVKMDVIGNNIANVGTTAFKGARVRFQDMLSQNVTEATGPGLNQGGINPRQVGLGVDVAGIDTIMKQGLMQPTSRSLDVAVDGEGFFMVGKGPTVFDSSIATDPTNHAITDAKDMNIMYTRDGAFTLDHEGNLLNSDGYRVLGYNVNSGLQTDGTMNYVNANDPAVPLVAADGLNSLRIPDSVNDTTGATPGPKKITSFSIGKEGLITAKLDNGNVTVLGQIAMSSFKNPAGLTKLGRDLYGKSANSGEAILRSGVMATTPGAVSANDNSKGYGEIMQSMLEMSNVDLAEQFTDMIITSRAFQASSKVISTGDEILQDILNIKR